MSSIVAHIIDSLLTDFYQQSFDTVMSFVGHTNQMWQNSSSNHFVSLFIISSLLYSSSSILLSHFLSSRSLFDSLFLSSSLFLTSSSLFLSSSLSISSNPFRGLVSS